MALLLLELILILILMRVGFDGKNMQLHYRIVSEISRKFSRKLFKRKVLLSALVEYDKYRFKSKENPKYVKQKGSTYCLVCEKKTNHKNIKGVALENKIG